MNTVTDKKLNSAPRALALRHSFDWRTLPFALLCGVSLFFVLASHLSCSLRSPTEEIVTTGISAPKTTSTPVILAPQLPAHDANIEAAGDRVAEAMTLLSPAKRRANAQTVTRAQRALGQATASLARALRNPSRNQNLDASLQDALKNLNSIERNIARGSYEEALRDLKTLDKKLDELAVQAPLHPDDAPSEEQTPSSSST